MEQTETENPNSGVANDSVSNLESGSGPVESSKGVGSSTLAEVLNWNRRSNLDAPAACTSQGAMEFLRVQSSSPQQKLVKNAGASEIGQQSLCFTCFEQLCFFGGSSRAVAHSTRRNFCES